MPSEPRDLAAREAEFKGESVILYVRLLAEQLQSLGVSGGAPWKNAECSGWQWRHWRPQAAVAGVPAE